MDGSELMLYIALFTLHGHYPGLNVLRYETFRSVLAGLAALALSLAAGPRADPAVSRGATSGRRFATRFRPSHQKKAGTPTMGGLLILASTALIARCCSPILRNSYVWIAMS